jgi:hypothetical protein
MWVGVKSVSTSRPFALPCLAVAVQGMEGSVVSLYLVTRARGQGDRQRAEMTMTAASRSRVAPGPVMFFQTGEARELGGAR